MLYQFQCKEHGEFTVSQPMMADHRAYCSCGKEGRRIYSILQWVWGGAAFRPDGSYREDKDYDCLKG